MCEADVALSARPVLFTFWTALKQHLTGLTIAIDPYKFEVQRLGALAMLPALQELEVNGYRRGVISLLGPEPYLDLLGGKLALKLPNLNSLRLEGFERGQLVLACPGLAKAELFDTSSFGIDVVDAFLTSLELDSCREVQVAMNSVEEQLQNLECLAVKSCSVVGGQLIGHVGHLQQLQTLEYTPYPPFPAAYMPESFPQSLVHLNVQSIDWERDLPQGLQEIHGLKDFTFRSDCDTWDITRPLAELLPMKSLQNLILGFCTYIREGVKAEWDDMHTPGLMRNSYRFVENLSREPYHSVTST